MWDPCGGLAYCSDPPSYPSTLIHTLVQRGGRGLRQRIQDIGGVGLTGARIGVVEVNVGDKEVIEMEDKMKR